MPLVFTGADFQLAIHSGHLTYVTLLRIREQPLKLVAAVSLPFCIFFYELLQVILRLFPYVIPYKLRQRCSAMEDAEVASGLLGKGEWLTLLQLTNGRKGGTPLARRGLRRGK
jgi:hypothetical protein